MQREGPLFINMAAEVRTKTDFPIKIALRKGLPREITSVGSKILPKFVEFLKSKDPNDGSEQALLDELKAVDEYLKAKGPYVNGENFCFVDLSLAMKLYHLDLALGHFKKWSVPETLTHVLNYKKLVFSQEFFKEKVDANKEYFIARWAQDVRNA